MSSKSKEEEELETAVAELFESFTQNPDPWVRIENFDFDSF